MVNSSFPTERRDRQGRTRDGRLLAGGGGGRHPLQGNANLMLAENQKESDPNSLLK